MLSYVYSLLQFEELLTCVYSTAHIFHFFCYEQFSYKKGVNEFLSETGRCVLN